MKNDRILVEYISENGNFHYKHSFADPPEETPRETHHDLFEICIFLKGDIMFFVEGLAYNLDKGDILCINNRELHRLKVLAPSRYERIIFHFNPAYIGEIDRKGAKALLDFMDNRTLVKRHKIEGGRVQKSPLPNLIKRIEHYAQEETERKDLMMKVLMVEILNELRKLQLGDEGEPGKNVRQDKRIRDITEYLNGNLEMKINLDDLADRFYVNKYHLCHLFKRETGFTVFEYITNKRIIKAKELILKGDSILDACYNSGFTDYANFYKAFKKVSGMSPKQFLKTAPPMDWF